MLPNGLRWWRVLGSNERLKRLVAWLVTATVLLAAAGALSKNRADADLWGHVQYGRDTNTSGIAATATYSYTAEGRPWINHELLSEWALSQGFDRLGARGLLLVKMALGLMILWVVRKRARQRQVSELAVAGARKILKREVDSKAHAELLDELAAKL